MKKYLLLTVLFTYLLGSFSLWQTLTTQQQINLDNCGDINISYNAITQTCDNQGNNSWLSTTPTTYEAVAWTPCWVWMNSDLAGKDNAVVRSSGIWCTCKDGFTRIDNECKSCSDPGVCCGISLNTSIPFIGKCIESKTNYKSPDETSVTWETAFPVLMSSLTKILVTAILIVSFVLIVVWGIMIATGNPSWWKKMIIKVVVGIAILGASWVILRLINPNFFG